MPVQFSKFHLRCRLKIECREYQLQLRDPFTISRGTTTVQPTLIVKVEYDGLVGYGEATTNDYYGITFESMSAALASVQSKVASYRLENPAELWRDLDAHLSSDRFAQWRPRLRCVGYLCANA